MQLLKNVLADATVPDHSALTHLKESLVIFVLNMQQLLDTKFPRTISIYKNGTEIKIFGFINELQDGGGICKSGTLIKDKLFPLLFPYTPLPAHVTETQIKQIFDDIFHEYLYPLIANENAYLRQTNAILQQKITAVTKPAPLAIMGASKFNILAKFGLFPFNYPTFPHQAEQNDIEPMGEYDSDNDFPLKNASDHSLNELK